MMLKTASILLISAQAFGSVYAAFPGQYALL